MFATYCATLLSKLLLKRWEKGCLSLSELTSDRSRIQITSRKRTTDCVRLNIQYKTFLFCFKVTYLVLRRSCWSDLCAEVNERISWWHTLSSDTDLGNSPFVPQTSYMLCVEGYTRHKWFELSIKLLQADGTWMSFYTDKRNKIVVFSIGRILDTCLKYLSEYYRGCAQLLPRTSLTCCVTWEHKLLSLIALPHRD